MDDPMLINVFFVGAEKYYRIELDGALLEHEVRKAFVNHVVQRGIRQEVCEDIFMVRCYFTCWKLALCTLY